MPTGAIYLTEASVGAPALSGTNGALCALLDWALPQKNWAIEHAAGHARVYRPGVGNRHRLFVAHDSVISGSAGLATVRGAEHAEGASMAQLVDPFPTEAQLSNAFSSFMVSNTVSSTQRPWRMVLSETFMVLAVSSLSLATTGWDLFLFGDVAGGEAGDVFGTIIHVGANNAISNASLRGMGGSTAAAPAALKTYWCRSIDGAVRSSRGNLIASTTSGSAGFMSASGLTVMLGGYGGRINREPIAASCIGSITTTAGASAMHRRGWVPNVWNPLHTGLGAVTADDEFTDTRYAAGSVFRVIPASSAIAAIIEASDTWSPPNG